MDKNKLKKNIKELLPTAVCMAIASNYIYSNAGLVSSYITALAVLGVLCLMFLMIDQRSTEIENYKNDAWLITLAMFGVVFPSIQIYFRSQGGVNEALTHIAFTYNITALIFIVSFDYILQKKGLR